MNRQPIEPPFASAGLPCPSVGLCVLLRQHRLHGWAAYGRDLHLAATRIANRRAVDDRIPGGNDSARPQSRRPVPQSAVSQCQRPLRGWRDREVHGLIPDELLVDTVRANRADAIGRVFKIR